MRIAITKSEGFLLAQIPIIVIYLSPFYLFVADNQYWWKLLLAFYVAVLFLFMVKIETGTQAELIFFDKSTRVLWEDGLCILPTLFPFAHHIGIHLFWWIKRQDRDPRAFSDTEPDITHHFDGKRMQYVAKVQTSLLAANVNRHLENMVGSFVEYKRGDPELLYQRVGFRLMVIIILFAAITNYTSPLTRQSNQSNPSVSNTQAGPSTKNTVSVSVQLEKQNKPIYPEKEFFTPRKDKEWVYVPVDGRKYFYYKDTGDKTPQMKVEDSRCVAVPAGKKIQFFGKYPPTYAVSMKSKIIYAQMASSVPFFTKVVRLIVADEPLDSPYYFMERSWERAYDEWDTIVLEFGFVAKARTLDELSPEVYGGLVCF